MSQTLLRIGLWTSLGVWVGSWAFFAFVVSRIAFQVLPGDIAGDLAGLLLTVLHWGGVAAALIAAGCAFGLGRRGGLILLPMGLALICILSELWLSPEVALVRPSVLGEANSAFSANRFRLLHRLSLGLFMAVHFASIGLLIWHARQDAQERSTPA
ncbi:MAG: DUF4149 domain-containing protein [Myxococcota bacterium]